MNKPFVVVAVVLAILIGGVMHRESQAKMFSSECVKFSTGIGAGVTDYTKYVGPLDVFCGVVLHISFDQGNTYQYLKVKAGQDVGGQWFSVSWPSTQQFTLTQRCDGISCPVLHVDMYLEKVGSR